MLNIIAEKTLPFLFSHCRGKKLTLNHWKKIIFPNIKPWLVDLMNTLHLEKIKCSFFEMIWQTLIKYLVT